MKLVYSELFRMIPALNKSTPNCLFDLSLTLDQVAESGKATDSDLPARQKSARGKSSCLKPSSFR